MSRAAAPAPPPSWLVLALVSGASTLGLEVSWLKRFSQVLGADIPALTAVTASLFLGLALGNAIVSRRASRVAAPLRTFGLVELSVATAALFTIPALALLPKVLAPFYPERPTLAFELLRFAGASSILLAPTTGMGLGLPLLIEATRRRGGAAGESFNRIYAVNTIGAALGGLLAGFVLLPTLGVMLGVVAATAGHVCNGLFALRLGARADAASPAAEAAPRRASATAETAVTTRRAPRAAALVFPFLLGIPTLVYESTWSRSLVLILGSTTYAYSILLAVFILGLGAGPLLVARTTDRVAHPWAWVAGLQFAIAFSAFAVKVVVGQLPTFVAGSLAELARSFGGFMMIEAAIAASVLIVPTLLLGCAFAFAARAVQETFTSGGEGAGFFLGANTLGNTTGSLGATFVLIPLLGIQGSITAASALTLGLGLWAIWLAGPTPRTLALAGVAIAIWAATAAFVPRWDPLLISSGPFLAVTEGETNYQATARAEDLSVRILAHEEGVMATVTVMEDIRGERSLTLNGKTTASTDGDMPTELLLGHLPLLLAPEAKHVLVIGMGSGISAAAVARHPVERIDVAEISPEVVALQPLFEDVNHNIAVDPRVSLLTIDGRTHLTYTTQKYDVITSEPSNPWIAGVGNLFSREFFETCRAHLAPGGIHCQWLQGYGLSHEDIASVIQTFTSVYPEATIWEPLWGSDFLLVAKPDGAIDLADLDRVWPRAAEDLATIGMHAPEDLVMTFFGGPELATTIGGGTIVTDDNLHLEFAAAKRLREVHGSRILIERGRAAAAGTGLASIVTAHGDGGKARLATAAEKRHALYETWSKETEDGGKAMIEKLLTDTAMPREQMLRLTRIVMPGLGVEEALYTKAQIAMREEDFASAIGYLNDVLAVTPGQLEATELLGEARFMAGDAGGAIAPLTHVITRQPQRWRAYNILGAALATKGNITEAIATFRRVPPSAGEEYGEAQGNLAHALSLAGGG